MLVYALKEKESDEIRYIGVTTKTINERFKRHLREKKITYKYNWINKVGKENIEYIILEDNITDRESLIAREIYYIKKYKDNGHRLTNRTEGGEGLSNFTFSDEHKRKISENHHDVSGENNPMFGKTHSDETKEKIRLLNTGRKMSKDFKDGVSKRNKGGLNNNATLTESDVINIRYYYDNEIYTRKELAEMYSVLIPAIYKIIHRITWKHL